MMSEITRAVICMPFYMAMDGEISQQQFYNRAQSLLADYDTLATRLAEAEVWLDEVATLCVTAERRVAELEEVIEQRNGECVSLHARVAELEARQGQVVGWYQPDAPYHITSHASVCAAWHRTGRAVAPLYAAPPPAPEVAGLVEALEEIVANARFLSPAESAWLIAARALTNYANLQQATP